MSGGYLNRLLRLVQLDGVTLKQRERALIALLVAAAAGYVAIIASDAAAERANAAIQSRDELESARAGGAEREREFPDALLNEQVLKARNMAFQAQTIAISQVLAQARIEKLAFDSGTVGVRVQLDGAPEGDGSLKLQRLTLRGRFDWRSFLAMLQSMAKLPQSINVTALSISNGPAPAFEMKVRVVLVEGASPAGAG
jgi:hypothetical protein